jgi:hypothetical protein
MAADIIIDMVADYVNIEFELLPEKSVLFKEGVFAMAPPEVTSAMRNMNGAGDRIRIPNWELNRNPWENAIVPTKSVPDTNTYTPSPLGQNDEYGIVVHRRKLIEWNQLNDLRRLWGAKAEEEAARQLTESIVYDVFDESLHSILIGAIPTSNQKDYTTATGSATYLTPERIVDATQSTLGDNMDNVDILVMHSAVWSRLRQLSYSTYGQATLINATEVGRPNIYMADGKIVYVTDKCPSATESGETKYTTYMLQRSTLSITMMKDFHLVLSPEVAENEVRQMRGNVDFIPHLKGIEYKETATEIPAEADLQNHNNWRLGRYPDAKMLNVIKVITN